ncbi:MAG: methyltransferase family protein [Candidatus Thorarchaeota archaeon]
MDKKNLRDRIVQKLTGPVGYLLPLMSSLPPLAAWSGLMTVPFIVYLLMMFGNISTAPPPLPDYIRLENIIILATAGLGLVLLVFSVVHLWREKSKGLVLTGPYKLVRHPQYFSLIVFTTMMTYQSVWILRNTFGIGWLSADQTLILWYLMLVAYVVIAWIEEKHLQKIFGDEWSEYRSEVGFLIPFVRFKSEVLEGFLSILIPIAILNALLYIPVIL